MGAGVRYDMTEGMERMEMEEGGENKPFHD